MEGAARKIPLGTDLADIEEKGTVVSLYIPGSVYYLLRHFRIDMSDHRSAGRQKPARTRTTNVLDIVLQPVAPMVIEWSAGRLVRPSEEGGSRGKKGPSVRYSQG